jgi:hypothetical protein
VKGFMASISDATLLGGANIKEFIKLCIILAMYGQFIYPTADNRFYYKFSYKHNFLSKMFNPYEPNDIKQTYMFFFVLILSFNLSSLSLYIYLAVNLYPFLLHNNIIAAVVYFVSSTAYGVALVVTSNEYQLIESIVEAQNRLLNIRIFGLSLIEGFLLMLGLVLLYTEIHFEASWCVFMSAFICFWKFAFTIGYIDEIKTELRLIIYLSVFMQFFALSIVAASVFNAVH